jgi:hypothetical protein
MSDRLQAPKRMVRRWALSPLVAVFAACSHQPPADYAPDPGLLSHIRDIEITLTPASVCPGGLIQASYQAVIDDGTRVPFIRSYDKKHPPRLHVVFLSYTSPEASSTQDGNWVTAQNPVLSAVTGFRLTATLKAKPSIQHTLVVPPDYSCMPHAFAFSGTTGGLMQGGGNGPDVMVQLGMGHSRFYEKLLVVGVEVGETPPFYLLYDARAIPPADWLTIESRGGNGGAGSQGRRGRDGRAGDSGCPAQGGGPGGDGDDGGPGAPGGRGGHVMVVVPNEQPFLAGLVSVHAPGGLGGPGGPAGSGGDGGKGGQGTNGSDNKRCADAADGTAGRKGAPGPIGRDGPHGPRHDISTVPASDVFGPGLPPELAALLAESRGRQ